MDMATVLLAALSGVLLLLVWRLLRMEKEVARVAEAPPASLQLLQREVQAVRTGVDERLREHLQHTHELSQRIGQLQKATEQVEQLGAGLDELQKILQPPQLRGAFGERLLEETLADMLPRDSYCLQYTYPKSGVRVDVAVLLGGGRHLPIDSKFPLENFRRYLDLRQSGSPESDIAQRAFVRDVKRHVDDIASKYLSPSDGAADVAFMYIPSESVFLEIVVSGQDADGAPLAEYALRKRVVPVSPNTLHAYLSVVRMGLRGFQLQESAREVLQHLTHLQSDVEELRDGLGTAIKQARHSLANLSEAESVLGRLEMRLDVVGSAERPGSAEQGEIPSS